MPVDISSILNLAKELVGKYTAPDKELQAAWERKDPRETAMRLANKINFAEGGVTAVPGAGNLAALRNAYQQNNTEAARAITDRIREMTNKYIQPSDRMLANQVKTGVVDTSNLNLRMAQTASRLNTKGGDIILALERARNAGDTQGFQEIAKYVLQNAKQFPQEIVSQVAATLRL